MNIRKFSMHYGAILGLTLALIAVLMWVLALDDQESVIPSILNNFVTIGFLFYIISYYRDQINHGYISYSESLKLGTSVAFFSSVIMAFYTFMYITYLSPGMLADMLNMTEQTILQSNPEISEKELDLALEMTAKLTQPHWLMIMGVLSGTFMGFFYSAILSLFVKRSDPNKIA
tara:strand:+ start:138 stop:659 length:522 start_codon:yes stop_codon:yes gene_type:complete